MVGSNSKLLRFRLAVCLIVFLLTANSSTSAGDPSDGDRLRRAIAYLDSRQDEWARFSRAQRGEGVYRTACVSCHSGIGYSLARSLLNPFVEQLGQSPAEQRMVAGVTLRVLHQEELDTPRFELMYDHDDQKKLESRGTEAVLNALILARSDANPGRTEPTSATRKAFQTLWKTQTTEGQNAGSWEWLNFGLQPWEANGSRAFGAALAAIAVGSAPGYRVQDLDPQAAQGIEKLCNYLKKRFPEENLYNRIWILNASNFFPDLVSKEQIRQVIDQLISLQNQDGGWALADLGDFKRVDGTPQSRKPDGHATGLALSLIFRLGKPSDESAISRGLNWLRANQQADGSWPGRSVNKERDPSTFIGHLMIDSATATAALALAEANKR